MRAWIGLGSNLDDPYAQLQRAVATLAAHPEIRVTARSPVYRNAALLQPGQSPQPDYLNAVVGIETTLDPLTLLDLLQGIERSQGRVRGERWGARTLDLDILLCDDWTIDHARLSVPHPGLRTRRFALQPLADIAPDLRLPDGTAIAGLLAACPPAPLEMVGRLA